MTAAAVTRASSIATGTCTWPWQVTCRRKLSKRTTLPTTLSCRYESSSSSSESSFFPWRHSSEALTRVVQRDNLSGLPIDKQGDTFFQQVLMASMLRRDWHEMLLPYMWKQSLANDCSWAFQKGVAALLSHIFRVPVDEIDKEDLGIVLDTESLPDTKDTEQDVANQDRQCTEMLEANLLDKYSNVDPSAMDLVLCMKPISSTLQSVFSIIFTREAVRQDPSLVESGRTMRKISRVSRDPLQVHRLLRDLDDRKKPISTFTVIADVSIDCLEAFRVVDKRTGDVVSGSTGEPQQVTHLVRFEVTTHLEGSKHLGAWKIVDWDDLLEGNVWY